MSASPLRAHLPERPEAKALRVLEDEAGSAVALSFGEQVPDDVATLVEGVPPVERLDASPALSTLVIPWAGVPARTRAMMAERPHVRVHNLHHNAAPAAEMAIALYLAAAKSILPRDAELRRGDWSARPKKELAQCVAGRTALVWGYGEIGRRVASACVALGMTVLPVARVPRPGVFGADDLNSLLPRADVLFVCVPWTDATDGRLGERELAQLPAGAVLVNVARGAVVDESALYGALRSRHLFGAGLDVWWSYPKRGADHAAPSAHPFGELDNVVMSPHRGGHVAETERLRMLALAELLRAQAEGRRVPHAVDIARGY